MNQLVTAPKPEEIPREKLELIKRTYCRGASDDEFALFMEICKRTNLDPISRQIYSIERWDSKLGRMIRQTQTSIDGFRVIAERSGQYAGQEGPFWCGEDGVWRDVWLSKTPPSAAKVTVFKKGMDKGFTGVALYSEYAQKTKQGQPTQMWAHMPSNQLAKCAESLALRKAFPNDMSGVYTIEEFPQETQEKTTSHKVEAIEAEEKPAIAALKPHNQYEEYEITEGSLRGTKLKDRPDAFWEQYIQTVTDGMDKMPDKFKAHAEKLLQTIELYLLEKQP